jgi:hypothetical protein
MAYYIDLEALRRKLIDKKSFLPAIVVRALDEIPTADVVEVVRCEKCFFAEMVVDIIGDPHLFCAEKGFRKVDFDDYCSKGKRSSK